MSHRYDHLNMSMRFLTAVLTTFVVAMMVVLMTGPSVSPRSDLRTLVVPWPAVVSSVNTGVGSEPYFNQWTPVDDSFLVALYGSAKVAVIGAVNDTLWKTISVQTEPTSIDVFDDRAWVTDRATDNVSVINLSTWTVIATIPVGSQPIRSDYDSNNGTVWVANYGGTNCTVLNSTTYAEIGSVACGTAPLYPLFDQDTNEFIVSDFSGGTVRFIGASNYTTFATISGLSEPSAMSNDPALHEVFVSDYGASEVSVIAHMTHTILANISVGSEPYGNGYDPQTGEDFTANSGSGTVTVIRVATNTVVKTLTVGTTPYSARAYDPVDGLLLNDNYGSANVSVISDGTGGSSNGTGGGVVATSALGNMVLGLVFAGVFAGLVLITAAEAISLRKRSV